MIMIMIMITIIIQICTSPLSVYTQYFTENIREEVYSDRELCAIINNNNILREHIESLPWLVGDYELSEEQTVDMNTLLSNVTAPLIELNTLAAHALGDLIIGDIDAAKVCSMMMFHDEYFAYAKFLFVL